jgi:hypothetical protein
MTTNEKGNIGLAKVIADVTENGIQPFLPLTDTTLIDLIISNHDLVTKKLQVKYISINSDGSLLLQLETVVNGKRILKDFSKIDAFAVYCPDNKNIYYIPTSEIQGKSFTIKVNEDKRGYKSLRSASDYLNVKKIF